jgi:hypothetical protein
VRWTWRVVVALALALPLGTSTSETMPCDDGTPEAISDQGLLLPGEAAARLLDRDDSQDQAWLSAGSAPLDWAFYDADSGALFSDLPRHPVYAVTGGTGFPPHVCLAIHNPQPEPAAFTYRWV